MLQQGKGVAARPIAIATAKALEGLRATIDYESEGIEYALGAADSMLRLFADLAETGLVTKNDVQYVQKFYVGSVKDRNRFRELNASAERLGIA